jgi:hypothetical protein
MAIWDGSETNHANCQKNREYHNLDTPRENSVQSALKHSKQSKQKISSCADYPKLRLVVHGIANLGKVFDRIFQPQEVNERARKAKEASDNGISDQGSHGFQRIIHGSFYC